MAEAGTFFEVQGTVTGRDGSPLPGVEVQVWWQHIRDRTALTKGETSATGTYRVRYAVPANAPARLLVVVEASAKTLGQTISSPLTEALQEQQIDLHVTPPDTSEWIGLSGSVQGLLGGLKLADLVEDTDHHDISFLSLELSKNTETIMSVALSARLEAAFKVPAAVFYAFLAQRIPTALPRSLLEASQDFTLIDALVQRVGSLIFGLSNDIQSSTVQMAVASNLISPQYAADIPKIVSQLQTLRTANLLNQPYQTGKSTLSQLLDVVKLPQDKQQAFAQALSSNSVSMRNFWRTLGDGRHGFTAAEASEIERTLSVGAFVKNHLPLVQLLLQRFSGGTYKTLQDLARLSAEDWIALVKLTGAPPSIDGAGTADPAEVFARVVYARVTRAYPTAALSSKVAAGNILPQPQRAPLVQFFTNNPTLELTKINIPAYLASQGARAFAGIDPADQATVVDNARRFQRVLRVTPSVDAAATLLELGIHSAMQIAKLGWQQFFVKATKAGISKTDADRIYKAGASRYAQTVSQYMQFNRDSVGLWPSAIGKTSDLDQPIQDAVLRDPTLATLFGSQDYCEVDDCTSVLSPAAYLCDLLLWLDNHPQSTQTALTVLDGRRPDIRHLLLNCPNTETVLPYIDLVNEVLADAISPPANPNSTINPPWKQTAANKTAQELRAAPEYFNQEAYNALATASYPQTLPYSAGLDELRTYAQQLNVPLWQLRQALLPMHSPSPAQQAAVAAERLNLAPHEVDLIVNADFAPADVVWNIANAPSAVAPVPAFLQSASLRYESMLELLQCSWVQGSLNISIQGISDTCDTSIQALGPAPLDAGFLDRAHRFLRLWRHAGYKMWELDLLLTAPVTGHGVLNEATLIALQTFWQLQKATGLAVDRQLAFYQNIDTSIHRGPDGTTTNSLYTRIFLNPSVTAAAPDPDLVALPTGGPIQDSNLSHHLAAIQAALGISAADAAMLFSLTNNQLTLDNLSLIYRVSVLVKACRFQLSDLLAVAGLLAPAAANTAAAVAQLFSSPPATLTFLSQAQAIQQSGFTIDALMYLLTPGPWPTVLQMTDDDIANTLGAARQALLSPTGGDISGSTIAAIAANAHRRTDQALANDVTAMLLQQLQLAGTGQTLLALLTDPSLASQTPITRANFANQFLAIQLLDKVGVVVRRLRLVSADLTWLLANAAVYGGLDFSQLPVVSNSQPALSLSGLLTTLLMVKLARLFNAAQPQSAVQTLYDMIDGAHSGTLADAAAAQKAVATITGWALNDVTSFAAAIGVTFPADYTNPAIYDSLRTLAAMARTATATGAQLVSWGSVPPNEPAAQAMAFSALGVVKALHPDNADWLTFAPTMTDRIRERRSAALQAYLIGQRDTAGDLLYVDVNGLFDHFLIDVQMSACEISTRVVQAYIGVQIFVERCLMNLEAPAVVVDLTQDDTWNQWEWMKRYRIWQANREVFLYPENWLVESQRPNRTEIYQSLEQEVRQNASTADYLETVVLNYVDRLDEIAHLFITGTCLDPMTNAIHVIGRTLADPPIFYFRSLVDGAWTGWTQIPLQIKATQAVPAMYRGRLCVFWLDVKVTGEPRQNTSGSGSQEVGKYVALGINFSIYRNGDWAPPQSTKGKFFDKPLLDSTSASDSKSVEALYTLKVQTPAAAPGVGASLFVDVFRFGGYIVNDGNPAWVLGPYNDAGHVARAVFDGRFNEMQQRNVPILVLSAKKGLLEHAQLTYGPDAHPLLPLPDALAEPEMYSEPSLEPRGGAFMSIQPVATGSNSQSVQLVFTASFLTGQNPGPLLAQAPLPFRVIGSAADLGFDPSSYFFFQDNKRSYYVETDKNFLTGSAWSPVSPSYPTSVPFELSYNFHRFYHPFTRLFWHQLSSGGFPALYDRELQLNPDQVDPSGAEVFSFQTGYQPMVARVNWDNDDTLPNKDREFLDFRYSAAYSVYNWELFFHIPLYMAEMLSQNQQFEDALTWFQYIFDPTWPGTDAAPKRFWIPKPLYNLTSADILAERINNLLNAVNHGNPDAVQQVESWRRDPFNPFLLADQRPVAYMKRAVMSYLDNLIAWADNLFASESREALSEATLLYVIASEILGPQPAATTPPQHADESYDQLAPKLDAFANAMVDIENTIGGSGGGGSGNGNGLPAPQTFYFKIPPNDTLLGYWTTIADRLFKLRHCQNIEGQALQLALFDAPIDPGLLIRAQSAGVDLGSVLSDFAVTVPNYRFTFLYGQALDFVNAVRAYGALLLAALEKSDADQLAVLLATNQLQLLQDTDQILEWQVEQAQSVLDALNQTLILGQDKLAYATDQSALLAVINTWEQMGLILQSTAIGLNAKAGYMAAIAAVEKLTPDPTLGVTGTFGAPTATATEKPGDATDALSKMWGVFGTMAEKSGALMGVMGKFFHQQDDWNEKIKEANDDIAHTQVQIVGAQLGVQIAEANRTKNQTQIDQLQKQLDFLSDKFTNQELYDWMTSQLSDTYFQSFKLAFRMCKQVEKCYQFELGILDSSFIQFGYWDSLHKGLLAGERLNHDLRRMQASYLDENRRRFELSRFVSLAALDPAALQQLLATGACDFDLPESLFDNDYPGHFNRHLFRVSVTAVYPSPSKFDNVKATLTLVSNKVRVSTDLAAGYPETPVGSDPRFVYNYAAVPQKIALGNAQDDPGLFLTALNNNLGDTRYLPFENAGAVSSWHLEMPDANNEIDLSAVGDVVLHLFYTSVDGGNAFKQGVQTNNLANLPTSGLRLFSAQNDFSAPSAAAASLTPWQAFLAAPSGSDSQTLTLAIPPSKFPAWTRGKTITVSSIGVLVVSRSAGNFVLQPVAPLPTAEVTLTPVPNVSQPNVCTGIVAVGPNTTLGTWTFKLRKQDAAGFSTITKNDVSDVFLLVHYQVN